MLVLRNNLLTLVGESCTAGESVIFDKGKDYSDCSEVANCYGVARNVLFAVLELLLEVSAEVCYVFNVFFLGFLIKSLIKLIRV